MTKSYCAVETFTVESKLPQQSPGIISSTSLHNFLSLSQLESTTSKAGVGLKHTAAEREFITMNFSAKESNKKTSLIFLLSD
jgi:hypothetical protein